MSVNIAGSVTIGNNQIDPIHDGLILYLDAGNSSSWAGGANQSWYDLSGRGRNTALEGSSGMDTWNYADNGIKKYGTLNFEGVAPTVITGVEFPNTSYSKCVWVNFNYRNYKSGPNVGGFDFIQNILSGDPSLSPHRLWYDGKDIWADNNNGGGGVNTNSPKETPILPGTWHFVCVTWSVDAGWSLYIDGILEAYAYDNAPLNGTDNAQIVSIGSENNGSNPMYGMMSIAMMYNRVLSAEEVIYTYSKFAPRYKKVRPYFVGQPYSGGTIITVSNLERGHANGIIDLGFVNNNKFWMQPGAPLVELGTSDVITAGKSNTDTIITYSSGYANYDTTAAWVARDAGNTLGYPEAFLPTLSYHTFIGGNKDFFDKRLTYIGDSDNTFYYWTSSETTPGQVFLEDDPQNYALRVTCTANNVTSDYVYKGYPYLARIAANFNI